MEARRSCCPIFRERGREPDPKQHSSSIEVLRSKNHLLDRTPSGTSTNLAAEIANFDQWPLFLATEHPGPFGIFILTEDQSRLFREMTRRPATEAASRGIQYARRRSVRGVRRYRRLVSRFTSDLPPAMASFPRQPPCTLGLIGSFNLLDTAVFCAVSLYG